MDFSCQCRGQLTQTLAIQNLETRCANLILNLDTRLMYLLIGAKSILETVIIYLGSSKRLTYHAFPMARKLGKQASPKIPRLQCDFFFLFNKKRMNQLIFLDFLLIHIWRERALTG